MQADDKQELVRVLNGMAAVKPGGVLTKEAYEMWWASMKAWSIDDFKDAAGHLLKTVEFMPNPFHFEQLRKLQRRGKHEAWTEAMSACLGWRNNTGSCDSAIDAAVAAIGGYRELAMCNSSKLHFLERRFLAVYDELVTSDETRAALPHITDRSAPRLGRAAPVDEIMQKLTMGNRGKRDAD